MIFPLSTGSSPALSASLDALCHGRFPKPTCFVFEFPLHSLPSDLVLTFLLLFVCRAISFFVFFIISKRLQDSRYQGLSSKAVGPQTGKRKSFQGKNGPVKKKMYILCFPPNLRCSALSEWLFLSWNAAAVGSKTFSLQGAAQQRSQGTERAGSLQRVHEGSRGKESTVMWSYWI